MVSERKGDGNFMKDRKIHSGSNVWSTSLRKKNIYGFDVNAGFDETGSVGYGKQCLLV